MTDATALAARYLAAWNERDPARRRALVAELWTADGTYVDPMAQAAGHDELAGLIGAVQERFPGLVFKPAGKADGYPGHIRFSWTLGPADGEGLAGGTDYASVADGRLKSVTGFLDFMPAMA
ncbi:polyketide cyclase [Alsobacter soli]|uniref:Polyketide cyclase n=1 Tax=Alsobacter soli TaxID=2109933 RepID=A0A2T1HWV8_9HYPH|nr:nuclear transport factor 2 family protein [Alsobacter soli]PSC06173.1 polyketide cyclase [Alsobacter soli]